MLLRTGPHHQLTCGHVAAKFNFYTRFDGKKQNKTQRSRVQVLVNLEPNASAIELSHIIVHTLELYMDIRMHSFIHCAIKPCDYLEDNEDHGTKAWINMVELVYKLHVGNDSAINCGYHLHHGWQSFDPL